MPKQSRLHRRLSPNGNAIFTLRVGDTTYNDHTLHSVVIRHGASGPEASYSPSTVEFSVAGLIGEYHNLPVRLSLNSAFAERYASYSGGAFAADWLTDRFVGRGAGRTIKDEAPDKATTTAQATSWSVLINSARRQITPVRGERVSTLLERALKHPGLGNRIKTKFDSNQYFDIVQGEVKPASAKDIVSKYGTGLGIHIQHERNGTLEFLPIARRRAVMMQQIESNRWPILRSQGISPATWKQAIENADKQFVLEYATSNGSEYSQAWPLPDGITPFMLEQQSVDWRHVTRDTDNSDHLMNSLTITKNLPRTELESLTIDMIYLLGSKNVYHRRIASQILNLHEGDAVFLSNDWVPLVRGPYFAQEITETITPDEWTFELQLSHSRKVLGLYDWEMPEVPARVWDSARKAWDSTNSTWNEGTV